MRFTRTTVIITGAADGLGSVMATAFAAAHTSGMISCIVPGGGTEDLVPVLGDDNRVGVQGAGSPRPRRLAQPAE